MLVNPHRNSKTLQIHTRGLPTSTEWPSCGSLPSTIPKKSPEILEASGHCLFLGNSSKTDKVPLAFCNPKPFSFQNGHSLLHTCTQILSLVIFATKAHFTSGLQLYLLEANFLPSLKIPSSHYTQVILQIQVWSKLFSLICLYTTLNLKSLFEHQKLHRRWVFCSNSA